MDDRISTQPFIRVVLASGEVIQKPVAVFGSKALVIHKLTRGGYDLTGARIETILNKHWVLAESGSWEGPFKYLRDARKRLYAMKHEGI